MSELVALPWPSERIRRPRLQEAVRYAELGATSCFSFLRGASFPEELVEAAALLKLDAIAITHRNTLAGVVRAHAKAKELGMGLVVGARLALPTARRTSWPIPRTAPPMAVSPGFSRMATPRSM